MIARIYTIAALIVVLGALMVLANGEHQHGEESTATGDTVSQMAKDSVFALIDAGFQRLRPILEDGCFDCHSKQTDYPWYHSLPLIKGMIDDDVEEGREHLLMGNGFPFGGHHTQVENLEDIREVLQKDEMPLWSYELMHWGAEPTDEEKDSIYAWVDSSLARLAEIGMGSKQDTTQAESHEGHEH